MSEHTQGRVDERQARQVAEAAREPSWLLPSFGKQLFLGDFQLGLIHPQPRPDEADPPRRGVLRQDARVLRGSVSGAVIERDAKIPDEVVDGTGRVGAFGMKISTRVRRARAQLPVLQPRADHRGSASPAIAALLSAHQSIGVPQPLALFGTDEQKQRTCPGAPAARSARSC